MSIFSKIGEWIKGWRLDKFFKGVANGDHEQAENLEATTTKAVEFVDKLKGWFLSPYGDIVTNIIPGDWDNDLKEKASAFLEKAAKNRSLISECASLPTAGEQLVCAYQKVVSLGDKDALHGFWHELGVTATLVFADGKLTFGDAAIAAEAVYRLVVKKKKKPVEEEV